MAIPHNVLPFDGYEQQLRNCPWGRC